MTHPHCLFHAIKASVSLFSFRCISWRVECITPAMLHPDLPVTESTHWEFAWYPLEILFELGFAVWGPDKFAKRMFETYEIQADEFSKPRVLFVGSIKSPGFFSGNLCQVIFFQIWKNAVGTAQKLALDMWQKLPNWLSVGELVGDLLNGGCFLYRCGTPAFKGL